MRALAIAAALAACGGDVDPNAPPDQARVERFCADAYCSCTGVGEPCVEPCAASDFSSCTNAELDQLQACIEVMLDAGACSTGDCVASAGCGDPPMAESRPGSQVVDIDRPPPIVNHHDL